MTILTSLLAGALRGARRTRRGWTALTPKLGPVGFYKGRGVPSAGRHTRKGERWGGGEREGGAGARGAAPIRDGGRAKTDPPPFFFHRQAPTKSCPKSDQTMSSPT